MKKARDLAIIDVLRRKNILNRFKSRSWIPQPDFTGEVKEEVTFHQYKRATYAITTPDKLYVFDGGTTEEAEELGHFYKNILGFDEIEAIFLSHYHNHHIGAIPRVIEYFEGNVNNVYSAGYRAKLDGNWEKETERTEELINLVDQYNINYQFLKAGDKVHDDTIGIDIVAPDPNLMYDSPPSFLTGSSPNDFAQLMVLFSYGDTRILLLGDPVRPSYSATFETYWFRNIFPYIHDVAGTTKANIVQLPHHGDRLYAGFDDWFYTLSPELLLMDNAAGFTEDMRLYLDKMQDKNPGFEYYSRASVPNAIKTGGFDMIVRNNGTYSFY